MKKTLVVLLAACVVFGAAAAFAQPETFEGREPRNQQPLHHPNMNFQANGQPAGEHRNQQQLNHPNMGGRFEACEGGQNFGRPCRNGRRGMMNFTPDMPKEIREKAVELAKLRVDLEEAMTSRPINKAKALDTHAKMQKIKQEIDAWRFAQKLERIEEFEKHRELNKKVPPAPMQPKPEVKEEAKDAQAE